MTNENKTYHYLDNEGIPPTRQTPNQQQKRTNYKRQKETIFGNNNNKDIKKERSIKVYIFPVIFSRFSFAYTSIPKKKKEKEKRRQQQYEQPSYSVPTNKEYKYTIRKEGIENEEKEKNE